MAAYPMPRVGLSRGSDDYQIDSLRTIRLGGGSLYGVALPVVKRGYTLAHSSCSYAEMEAIRTSYETNRAAATITFVWKRDGATKTTRWVKPPDVKDLGGNKYAVTSNLEQA